MPTSSPSHHTPILARGFSQLDKEDTHWKAGFCPYKSNKGTISEGGNGNVIERIDEGAIFYRKHFFGKGKSLKPSV